MSKRDLLAPGIPALGVAAYVVIEMGSRSAESWFAGLIAFAVTFLGGAFYWSRNKHKAGTAQDALNLLPRFKGIKK